MNDLAIETVVIRDPIGLHARPAIKVSKLAKKFDANIELSISKGERWVNAKSVNAVMKLKATAGAQLLIRAKGTDANTAVENLADLIEQSFQDGSK